MGQWWHPKKGFGSVSGREISTRICIPFVPESELKVKVINAQNVSTYILCSESRKEDRKLRAKDIQRKLNYVVYRVHGRPIKASLQKQFKCHM